MTIFRPPRCERYTTIATRAIEDVSLSFRARAIQLYLLSKRDDWRTTSTQLAAATTEGRDAIRAALRELETAGYLERTKRRTAGGQWCTETVVHESPGHTGDGKPGVGGPGV